MLWAGLVLFRPGYPASAITAHDPAADSLEILFFANANALLENCHCGAPSLGGLARINTIVAQKRQKNPELLLIDGGDFFNPYSYKKLNLTLLQIYHILQPDILSLGDQEFVEGADFLKHNLTAWSAVVTSNFEFIGQKTAKQRMIHFRREKVKILTYLDKSSFDVIPFDKKHMRMDYPRFEQLYSEKSTENFLIVVFHGSNSSLQAFVKTHPRVNLILAAHSQLEEYQLERKPAIVYGGVDARFIYDIQINFSKKGNQLRCQPIPVTEDIRQDNRILPILKQFKAGR